MSALVQGCDSADVDAVTQVCAHPYWTLQNSLLPPLDIAGGSRIAVAILLVWATAYCWNVLKRGAE